MSTTTTVIIKTGVLNKVAWPNASNVMATTQPARLSNTMNLFGATTRRARV
jgi:hypothetical protein